MSKRIVVTVISDLATDQRVHKVCQALHENGYAIFLIGSKKRASLPLDKRDYTATRISLLFQKKIFFYAEFNIRLFVKLLFTNADIFLGNDLDVMPATYLAAKLRAKPMVYDTHEYFTEMAGLENKHFRKKIWRAIEAFIFPRVRHIYTICESFCDLYKRDYNKELRSVRNVPYLHYHDNGQYNDAIKKITETIPNNKNILIFQGAGINPMRGAEELVLAMQYLDPQKYHLLIVGGGDIFSLIEEMVRTNKLSDRVTIIPKVPFAVLRQITACAHLGLSLDKSTNINHRYGLPNKIFDYLHAGIPVLSSRLVEVEKIINKYNVGTFVDSYEPEHIASCIKKIFADHSQMKIWKDNTEKAKKELNWENESKIVLDIFKQVEAETVN